jgi:hypothetical protein
MSSLELVNRAELTGVTNILGTVSLASPTELLNQFGH